MFIQITTQKLRENGEVVSEQHLFIEGNEDDLSRDSVLLAIDYADQNCVTAGRKLYSCPKMLIEIMDVLQDNLSGEIRMVRASEDIPFSSDITIQDHYVLTLDSKELYTSVEINGEEWESLDSDAKSVMEQGTLFEGVKTSTPAVEDKGSNATMWASGRTTKTWTNEEGRSSGKGSSEALPQPANDGVRPSFE